MCLVTENQWGKNVNIEVGTKISYLCILTVLNSVGFVFRCLTYLSDHRDKTLLNLHVLKFDLSILDF